jgi:hypothetical protein
VREEGRAVIVVTLVHGTILLARWPLLFRFLRRVGAAVSGGDAKPRWHHRDSPFAIALRDALGEDGKVVDIRSFDWTGGNTVWDRLSAAGTLRQHIARIAQAHPQAAQVIVGHSHGGSVCLAALGDPETRQQVTAFVSLATPYVHVWQRPDSQDVETALRILGFLVFTAVMLATMWWLEPRVGEAWNAVVFTLLLFAVIALGANVWNRHRVRIEAVREWARTMNVDQTGGPARLIVVSDGDEALLALKIAEALNAMSRGLWRAAYRIVELVERVWVALRWRAWVLYAGVAAAFLVFFLKYDATSPWGPVDDVPLTIWFPLKAVFTALIAPVFVFLAAGIALFVPTLAAMLLGFPPLVFFRWLAFGWGGAPGMDITAESLPLGTVTAVRLPAPAGRRGLRHSELYNDARVPPLIATFVQREAGAGAAAGEGPGLV